MHYRGNVAQFFKGFGTLACSPCTSTSPCTSITSTIITSFETCAVLFLGVSIVDIGIYLYLQRFLYLERERERCSYMHTYPRSYTYICAISCAWRGEQRVFVGVTKESRGWMDYWFVAR
jgi:hypothetical protein